MNLIGIACRLQKLNMGQKLTVRIVFFVIITIVFLVVGTFLLISSRFKGDFPSLEKRTTFNDNDVVLLKTSLSICQIFTATPFFTPKVEG